VLCIKSQLGGLRCERDPAIEHLDTPRKCRNSSEPSYRLLHRETPFHGFQRRHESIHSAVPAARVITRGEFRRTPRLPWLQQLD
jgi:hypothetical protein